MKWTYQGLWVLSEGSMDFGFHDKEPSRESTGSGHLSRFEAVFTPRNTMREAKKRLEWHHSYNVKAARESLTEDLIKIVDEFIELFPSPGSSSFDGREEGEC